MCAGDAAELEIPLTGGRVTPGVVRAGDTVRRPPAANAVLVRRLLGHLARRGFEGCPAWLGTDARGREVFRFIVGTVPADLGFHSDDALAAAARLIRRFHDLGAEISADGVVCHNDLSPCNFVFRDGLPVAIIDFDAAAPGPRMRDLGYATWLWLDIGGDMPAEEQGRRLAVFTDAYGGIAPGYVVTAMMERQAELASGEGKNGQGPLAEWSAACLAWTMANRARLLGR
ncbi:MAG: phosphotransferase [Rhizobiales bacterium]|nr:phosphotransferase [Hyphomicrobiales bacterium]